MLHNIRTYNTLQFSSETFFDIVFLNDYSDTYILHNFGGGGEQLPLTWGPDVSVRSESWPELTARRILQLKNVNYSH
jgi:hypothetical protein